MVFIDLAFDRLLKPPHTPLVVVTAPEYAELRTNYLRYVEGSINMIIPLLLFGAVFPTYAHEALSMPDVSATRWVIGTLVVALLLGFVAYETYKSYTDKLAELSGQFPPAKPTGTTPPVKSPESET